MKTKLLIVSVALIILGVTGKFWWNKNRYIEDLASARSALQASKWDVAEELKKHLLAYSPNAVETRTFVTDLQNARIHDFTSHAEAALSKTDFMAADQYAAKAQAVLPNHEKTLALLTRIQFIKNIATANKAIQAGDWGVAENLKKEIISQFPVAVETQTFVSNFQSARIEDYASFAEAALGKNDFAHADQYANKAQAVLPNHEKTLALLARIQSAKERYALDLDADARAFLAQNNFDAAQQKADQAANVLVNVATHKLIQDIIEAKGSFIEATVTNLERLKKKSPLEVRNGSKQEIEKLEQSLIILQKFQTDPQKALISAARKFLQEQSEWEKSVTGLEHQLVDASRNIRDIFGNSQISQTAVLLSQAADTCQKYRSENLTPPESLAAVMRSIRQFLERDGAKFDPDTDIFDLKTYAKLLSDRKKDRHAALDTVLNAGEKVLKDRNIQEMTTLSAQLVKLGQYGAQWEYDPKPLTSLANGLDASVKEIRVNADKEFTRLIESGDLNGAAAQLKIFDKKDLLPYFTRLNDKFAAIHLELNTLGVLAKDAQNAADRPGIETKCKEILTRSEGLKQRAIDSLSLWRYRAIAAILLNQTDDGWEAGKNLKRLGALSSKDPLIVALITQLNAKKWLTENNPEESQKKTSYFWLEKASREAEKQWLAVGYQTNPDFNRLFFSAALAQNQAMLDTRDAMLTVNRILPDTNSMPHDLDSVGILLNIAETQLASGLETNARETLSKATEHIPQTGMIALWLDRDMHRAEILGKIGEVDEAKRLIAGAEEQWLKTPNVLLFYKLNFHLRAIRFFKKYGMRELADEQYKKLKLVLDARTDFERKSGWGNDSIARAEHVLNGAPTPRNDEAGLEIKRKSAENMAKNISETTADNELTQLIDNYADIGDISKAEELIKRIKSPNFRAAAFLKIAQSLEPLRKRLEE